jgi:hypothetical protein
VARTCQVLWQGSNASDVVPFIHRILHGLTEPVGIVDRDHFSAIRARFGVEIPTVPATQAPLDTGN